MGSIGMVGLGLNGSGRASLLSGDGRASSRKSIFFRKERRGNMCIAKSNKINQYLEPAYASMDNADFFSKVKAAWKIFFPQEAKLSPKEEGKKRLRMILVADRCGMSEDSLQGMRDSIVRAMSEFVEVEQEEAVEVNMSTDPDQGTVYSVAVPVRRVKPQLQPNEDMDIDVSDQFPYGTEYSPVAAEIRQKEA